MGLGASGFVIVKDDLEKDGLPACLLDIPQRLLMLHPIDPSMIQMIQHQTGDQHFNMTGVGCPADTFVLLNGLYKPQVQMVNKQWQRWRVVNSGLEEFVRFRPNSMQCDMLLLAKDGVYIKDLFRPVQYIVIPPGGRSDFLVRCDVSDPSQDIPITSFIPNDLELPHPNSFNGTFATITFVSHLNTACSPPSNKNIFVDCQCGTQRGVSPSQQKAPANFVPAGFYKCPPLVAPAAKPWPTAQDSQICTPNYPAY